MSPMAETYSVCPVCLKRIKAAYVKKEGGVYLEKECPEHGRFSCLASRAVADFESWQTESINIPPKAALRPADKGCPHDCGPCPEHLQTACCVLIDLTERCNQHCPVCFASASVDQKREPDLAEIERKYEELIRLSEERKFNIQLSGGEPTVRDDLPEIVKLAKAKGFEYVQLNTNGKRIGQEEGYAQVLKEAGVDAVFMQFDGLSEAVYRQLRNEDLLEIKKKAIENCRRARLPVALVPTIARGVNDQEIGGLIQFMLDNVDTVKGLHFQPLSFFGRYPKNYSEEQRFTMFDVIDEIQRQTGGAFSKADLKPISTGHALCCFYGNYARQADGSIICTSTRKKEPAGCCEAQPCCPPLIPLEVIAKDRDFVLNKWKVADRASQDGFDAFLNHMRENSFTLTGMAFQDAMSLDAERLKRCRVQVLTEDRRLVPFCAYNLTDLSGNYLYRS